MSDRFARYDGSDVRALVEQYPLAWVCAAGGDASSASQLPLIGEYDAQGNLVALIGHLARANPLAAQLAEAGGAQILFNGPSGYVSPEHAGVADWAPTWNYAQLKVQAAIEIDGALTEMALAVLIDAMERDRAQPWTGEAIAYRRAGMVQAIIGFRATVTSLTGRFKLAQDERPEVLRSILATHPDPALVRWMQRMNQGRC